MLDLHNVLILFAFFVLGLPTLALIQTLLVWVAQKIFGEHW